MDSATDGPVSWQRNETPPAKPSKACVPCHSRKVKCDAALKGPPCSGCVSRRCTDSCVLAPRKRRRKTDNSLTTRRKAERLNPPGDINSSPYSSNHAAASGRSTNPDELHHAARTGSYSHCEPTPESLDCQDSRQSRPELNYLNILKDAVDPPSNRQCGNTSVASTSPGQEETFTSQIRNLYKPPQLDDFDKEFLAKKGVFDLPPQRYVDALLRTFFDYVFPYVPVIDRVEFLQGYRTGNYSLFLLYAMLTPATLHVPADVISGCGFDDRSMAQASFMQKATLLHDFQVESDLLHMLQGSIILGIVIRDHPTDKDFHYWHYNSVRLAIKLDIHKLSTRENGSSRSSKLYHRIWWVLYCRDVFLHMYSGTRSLRLIGNDASLKPTMKNDWEPEEIPGDLQALLPSLSNRQKLLFPALCELAQIVGHLISAITHDHEKNPQQIIRPLDSWRMFLAEKLQIRDQAPDDDIYYAELRGSSYRFETIICRLVRHRWQSRDTDRCEWARQRLRSAMFELDGITRRMLENGTIQEFPVSFMTAIPMLLALHIETALDTSETDLIRSMARISIGQSMLALGELKEIPVIKRAIPIFEMVLAKKNLYAVPPATAGGEPSQVPVDDLSEQREAGYCLSQDLQGDCTSFLGDLMDFNVLDRWEAGQLDFPGVF